MLSLMGFTPVDRSRLGVSGVKALSKVDEIRRRAREERGNVARD